jgi:hypothetical protein
VVFVASDHRVLVVFTSSGKDPLKICVQNVKALKREKMELKKQGKTTRTSFDTCRPHTTIVGGKDKVIIIERIGDKIMDQKDDVNNQM